MIRQLLAAAAVGLLLTLTVLAALIGAARLWAEYVRMDSERAA